MVTGLLLAGVAKLAAVGGARVSDNRFSPSITVLLTVLRVAQRHSAIYGNTARLHGAYSSVCGDAAGFHPCHTAISSSNDPTLLSLNVRAISSEQAKRAWSWGDIRGS
jgi:hypothetical protein